MSYVVTGATGNVGSATVNYLLSQSIPVRAVIRSENKAEPFRSRHVDVAIADLNDVQALTKAFQGAKAVFAMNPPALYESDMHAAAHRVSQALASAIQAAKVQRVVVLSSWGAERTTKTGNILTAHILEEALKNSAPQVVMIRAASFMENWLGTVSAVKSGQSPVLGSILQKLDRKIPHIATDDIGRVVAEFMIKPDNEVNQSKIIELEGPESYSPNDVAKITSDALGKPIAAVAMSDDMARDLFNKFGWPKTTIDSVLETHKSIDDNTVRWTDGENVIRIKGKVTLADVLNKSLH